MNLNVGCARPWVALVLLSYPGDSSQTDRTTQDGVTDKTDKAETTPPIDATTLDLAEHATCKRMRRDGGITEREREREGKTVAVCCPLPAARCPLPAAHSRQPTLGRILG
jgi:hypothetical protein